MFHPFIQHLKNYIAVQDTDADSILSFTDTIELKKKQNLFAEGQLCRANYFVVKGCLRMFFIDDKGTEQTTHFAIENWWLTDHMSLLSRRPTDFCLQAVEKSIVLAINNDVYEGLIRQFPAIESYFRIMHQRALAASQYRIKYLHDFSKEEAYEHFSKNEPAFAQRIPQYLLASYLGFTPEYLSELRKKRKS
ncbi:Crp/Fnr family transcriptional regulator [Chitinophaga flava]|uniref:Crp/Fnr family transcriptional regulator n=1 Tax=Chitinophaga flava TaxID=2259036 RepID=A0A365Y3L8_9BACT|nr:Crp/Fnr family transcriptional regulator [Chitinophaga flava]RBL92891.1 Crp/Fnr family transcriptional regulator [Chitinophaga flava]